MRAFVREFYAEGIALGETDVQLKARGVWLRENVGDDLANSVAAITAHVRQGATRALERNALSECVARDNFIAACFHPSEIVREEARRSLSATLSEQSAELPARLITAMQEFRAFVVDEAGKQKAVPEGADSPDRSGADPRGDLTTPSPQASLSELSVEGLRPEKASVLDDTDSRRDTTGDRVSYDVPVKRAWRATLASFLDRHVPGREFFADAWVLCNPSQHPDPEASLYLERGVRPERIIAVERSADVYPAFKANCERLGITPVFGGLDEVIPRLEQKFSIVSLDYVGQVSEDKLLAIQHLPLAPRAVLMLNYRIGREDRHVQAILKEAEIGLRFNISNNRDYVAKAGNDEMLLRRFGGESPHASGKQSIAAITAGVESAELRDVRTDSIGRTLLTIAGISRKGRNPLGFPRDSFQQLDGIFQPGIHNESQSPESLAVTGYLKGICKAIHSALHCKALRAAFRPIFTADDTDSYEAPWGGLYRDMLSAIYARLWMHPIVEEYEYKSQSGSGRSRFYTTLGVLQCPYAPNVSWRDAPLFVYKSLIAALRAADRGYRIEGLEFRCVLKAPKNPLAWGASKASQHLNLELRCDREAMFGCSIRAKEFLTGWKQMQLHIGGDGQAQFAERKIIAPSD